MPKYLSNSSGSNAVRIKHKCRITTDNLWKSMELRTETYGLIILAFSGMHKQTKTQIDVGNGTYILYDIQNSAKVT